MGWGISFHRHLDDTFFRPTFKLSFARPLVAVVSKQWAVSSMLAMLSEPCTCWLAAADVGSGH